MNFPLRFNNQIVPEKKLPFSTWWNMNVKKYDDTDDINFPESNGEYVKSFCFTLKNIITKTGFSIQDEKRFKNEITTFIYQLSNER